MPKNVAASPEEIARLRSLYKEIQELQWKLTSGPAASTAITLTMATERISTRLVIEAIKTLPQDFTIEMETAKLIIAIAIKIQTCLQIGGISYGFIKLRQIFKKHLPNSIFTFNQQIPPVMTQLRQGDELSSKNLTTINRELTSYHQQLSSRSYYPLYLCLMSFGMSRLLTSLLSPLLEDSEYSSYYYATKNAILFGGIVGPIVGYTLTAIGNRYKNRNQTNRVEKAKKQFQDHFSPQRKFTWQVAGNKSIQTKILYTSFQGKNTIKIKMDDGTTISIPAKRYFLELAKVLVQMELNFLLVTKDGIFIGLEETLGLVTERAQETLYQRLRNYKKQQEILEQLNTRHEFYANKWQHVEQDNDSIFYINTNIAPDDFLVVLKSQYSDVEVIKRDGYNTFVLNNPGPKTTSSTSSSSSSSKGEGTWPFDHSDSTKATSRKRPSKSKKAEEPGPSAPKTISKPIILVSFPKVHLQFDSATYDEETALMRPMNATWLPDYCHFSYLDPRISIYLPGDLNLSQILGILRSGQTFPSGILKWKTGGVGICVAHEPYTNIHGQTFISDYKIKTKGYRLHGRLHDTATDKRRRVYIFDGVRKHGH